MAYRHLHRELCENALLQSRKAGREIYAVRRAGDETLRAAAHRPFRRGLTARMAAADIVSRELAIVIGIGGNNNSN